MYYKTDKNQHYKVNKDKSIKVSEEEYQKNDNRLDKFSVKDLKTMARGYNREVEIKNVSKLSKKKLIGEIVKATKRYPYFHKRVNGDIFKLIKYFEDIETEEAKKKISSKRKSPVVVKKISSKRKISEKKESKPAKGDIVKIIIKPYDKKVTVNGVVKDVLTKKERHTRGHKVRLQDGTVGRLIKILKAKKK
jgi:uncharacterized repeat protein (TIGR03833 family)